MYEKNDVIIGLIILVLFVLYMQSVNNKYLHNGYNRLQNRWNTYPRHKPIMSDIGMPAPYMYQYPMIQSPSVPRVATQQIYPTAAQSVASPMPVSIQLILPPAPLPRLTPARPLPIPPPPETSAVMGNPTQPNIIVLHPSANNRNNMENNMGNNNSSGNMDDMMMDEIDLDAANINSIHLDLPGNSELLGWGYMANNF